MAGYSLKTNPYHQMQNEPEKGKHCNSRVVVMTGADKDGKKTNPCISFALFLTFFTVIAMSCIGVIYINHDRQHIQLLELQMQDWERRLCELEVIVKANYNVCQNF